MEKWFQRALIGTATIIMAGCTTPMTPQEIGRYFDSPSTARFEEPIYVIVTDERSDQERKGVDWSDRYIVTVDGTDTDRTSRFFAEDLASLLQRKRIVNKAYPVKRDATLPENSTIVTVRLLSWYGRVTDFSKLPTTERVTMALLGNTSPAYDNHGECRFSAAIVRSGVITNLGVFDGEYTLFLKGGTMEHANALSAAAADGAFVKFLQAVEKTFGTSAR